MSPGRFPFSRQADQHHDGKIDIRLDKITARLEHVLVTDAFFHFLEEIVITCFYAEIGLREARSP